MIIKKLTTTIFFVFFGLIALSQTNADILGEWFNAEKDAVITIFEENETISAKITWMKLPNDANGKPKTDLLNPDESLRSIERVGLLMLSNVSHIAGNVWDNGILYIAEKGKIYSGMMKFKNKNTIYIKGYVGFTFFERYSSTWTRVLDKDQFRNETIDKENVLTNLKEDLMDIVKLIENISLKPAEEIIQKIDNESLLIKLKVDLSRVIKKIDEIKKPK